MIFTWYPRARRLRLRVVDPWHPQSIATDWLRPSAVSPNCLHAVPRFDGQRG
jgi:hypothetical protein